MDQSEASVALARELWSQGLAEEALDLLDFLAEQDDANPELRRLRGDVLYAMNEWREAAAEYAAAEAAGPLPLDVRLRRATCWEHEGETDQARREYAALADAADACSCDQVCELAAALGRLGELERCEGLCRRWTRSRTGCSEAWFALACCRARLRRPMASVEQALRRAAALSPDAFLLRAALLLVRLRRRPIRAAAPRSPAADRLLASRVWRGVPTRFRPDDRRRRVPGLSEPQIRLLLSLAQDGEPVAVSSTPNDRCSL